MQLPAIMHVLGDSCRENTFTLCRLLWGNGSGCLRLRVETRRASGDEAPVQFLAGLLTHHIGSLSRLTLAAMNLVLAIVDNPHKNASLRNLRAVC